MFLLSKTSLFFTLFFFFSIILLAKGFDIEKDLIFRLYTRDNKNDHCVLKLVKNNVETKCDSAKGTFKPNLPTRIFIHGFRTKEKIITPYVDAFLKVGDYNVIIVDWIAGAISFNYIEVKKRVRPISEKLAQLLDGLVAKGLKLQDVTMVGHSLGAHIAGRSAKNLKTKEKIGVIIGLDPASVLFDFSAKEKRLDVADAAYVQVIHTDIEKFGIAKPIGDADFYPNFGENQPGCPIRNKVANLKEICSHKVAHDLFLESLTTKFESMECSTYDELKEHKCTFNGHLGVMGGDINKSTHKSFGIHYLETNIAAPYNIPDHKKFKNVKLITKK